MRLYCASLNLSYVPLNLYYTIFLHFNIFKHYDKIIVSNGFTHLLTGIDVLLVSFFLKENKFFNC